MRPPSVAEVEVLELEHNPGVLRKPFCVERLLEQIYVFPNSVDHSLLGDRVIAKSAVEIVRDDYRANPRLKERH